MLGVTTPACPGVARSQQGQAAPTQSLGHALEVLLDKIRPKVGIERLWIGPAEHLMLQERIINAVEEFPKPDQQVTFGHQEVNREADIQRALNQIELLVEPAGFVPDGFLRVTNEALNREHEEEAVDGAVRTGPF